MSRTSIVCLLVCALALGIAPVASALTLRVEQDAVVASDVTRFGKAVFFAVTYEGGTVPMRSQKATVLRDDDGDGVIKLAMPDGVPFIGIWSVVDLANGAVQLGTKENYELIELEEPLAETFKRADRGGGYDRIEQFAGDVEMLVVRPGEGAWTMNGAKGGEEDLDFGATGKLVLGFGRLRTLSDRTSDRERTLDRERTPGALRDGDVVVVINVGEMRASAATLGAAK